MAINLVCINRESGAINLNNDCRKILKIKLQPGHCDLSYAMLSDAEGTRFMNECGMYGTLVEVDFSTKDSISITNEDRQKIQDMWNHILDEGFTINVVSEKAFVAGYDVVDEGKIGNFINPYHGKVFNVVGCTAGGTRVNCAIFMERRAMVALVNNYTMGLANKIFNGIVDENGKLKGIPMEKIWIYILQMFSSTSVREKAFTKDELEIIPKFNIRRAIVCPDMEYNSGDRLVNFVKGAMTQHDYNCEIVEKVNDGLVIQFTNGDFEPYSVRLPGVKGLAYNVDKTRWIEYAHSMGVDKIVDIYGVDHAIEDVDVIFFPASFKWYKAFNTLDGWHLYQDKIEEYGHDLLACKFGHAEAVKRYPAQPMMALMPSKEDEELLINKAETPLLRHMTIDGMTDMIGNRQQRLAAKMFPDMVSEPLMAEELQSRHLTSLVNCLTGCLPEAIRYTFAVPDPKAIFDHILGLEIKPLIKEHECVVDLGKDKNGVPVAPKNCYVLINRNPCPGRDILVRMNIEVHEEYSWMYKSHACFFSVVGLAMKTLQMDFDGDTVGIVSTFRDYGKAILRSVVAAWKQTGYRTVYFDNVDPGKHKWDVNEYRNILRNQQASKVGIIFDGINRMTDYVANMVENGQNTGELNVWFDKLNLMAACGTLIIDAAKNGNDNDSAASAKQGEAYATDMRKVPGPMHIFWKKSVTKADIEANDYDLQKVIDNCMDHFESSAPKFIRRNTWMGRYVGAIQDNVPAKLSVDELIENGELSAWNKQSYRMLCNADAAVRRPGNMFKLMDENGVGLEYKDGAVNWDCCTFGKIVGEVIGLRDSIKNARVYREQLKDVGDDMRRRIFDACYDCVDKNGNRKFNTEDECLNGLIMCVYSVTGHNEAQKIIVKNARDVLWDLFGNRILKNIAANTKNTENLAKMIVEDIGEEAESFDDDDLDSLCFGDYNDDGAFYMD